MGSSYHILESVDCILRIFGTSRFDQSQTERKITWQQQQTTTIRDSLLPSMLFERFFHSLPLFEILPTFLIHFSPFLRQLNHSFDNLGSNDNDSIEIRNDDIVRMNFCRWESEIAWS